MGRLADGAIVHGQVIADPAHDHLTGVQPDADPERNSVLSPNLVAIGGDGFLHPQGRVTRPHGVVLVGDRRSEERHDAIAHHLIDRAFVVMDGVHHALDHGIENLSRFLGVAADEQLHRPLQIREQNSHLLALALEGVPDVADPLG